MEEEASAVLICCFKGKKAETARLTEWGEPAAARFEVGLQKLPTPSLVVNNDLTKILLPFYRLFKDRVGVGPHALFCLCFFIFLPLTPAWHKLFNAITRGSAISQNDPSCLSSLITTWGGGFKWTGLMWLESGDTNKSPVFEGSNVGFQSRTPWTQQLGGSPLVYTLCNHYKLSPNRSCCSYIAASLDGVEHARPYLPAGLKNKEKKGLTAAFSQGWWPPGQPITQ